MSIETVYLMRKDEPGAPFRDLDDVRVLVDVTTDEGTPIAAGTEGTVVGTWDGGASCIVEFAEPMGALATLRAESLERVSRAAA